MELLLELKVFPNSKKDSIEKDGALLKVRLTAPAVNGRANKALIKFLSKEYNVRKSSVTIIRGEKSQKKLVRIFIK